MSRKSRFFSWNLEGFVLQAKNNTCFACTKCNITEKNMKHPAMLARVKIENCRFAREREICIEKMASSIFLSSCIFSSNPWLSSWNRLQAWNAWHGKESTRSHLNASWHFYNVRKYLKNVSFSKIENIIICFLKEIRIWKYFSLTKIVKNRENRNDKSRTPSSHFSYFSQFSQFLQNFDTKKDETFSWYF